MFVSLAVLTIFEVFYEFRNYCLHCIFSFVILEQFQVNVEMLLYVQNQGQKVIVYREQSFIVVLAGQDFIFSEVLHQNLEIENEIGLLRFLAQPIEVDFDSFFVRKAIIVALFCLSVLLQFLLRRFLTFGGYNKLDITRIKV